MTATIAMPGVDEVRVTPGTRKAIVLVVDDNADSLGIIAGFLEHCGMRVFTAQSAEAAVQIGRTVVPDIVISDLSMPGKDGYWLLRQLRAVWCEHPLTPAIAITAYRETQRRDKAIRAGFQEYVEKPLDLPRLLAIIGRALPSLAEI